ncbi:unnamed protein product [Peronospora belbahrii]|uniref:Major facilitator superfamily (MFS) profile domain-containing protein n=1 Tax=Peronospora belbahrii TaxID=622444 RepID=A0AAU9L3U9_9STRA|nr:unnamed protein product [Peronospora belbahrii]CAH0516423.1 unnamed protein product [Peronospora belbahrii]
MKSSRTTNDSSTSCKLQQKCSISRKFGAIVGLQFLVDAAFGVMSPIISIVMTEYFARLHRNGLSIDCGTNPHEKACIKGSQEAAWVSSLFSALGSVLNFVLAPMLGQASDVYGRKPFLVLSQLVRVGTPFSVMYFMQLGGSIAPYLVLRLIDYGFGTAGVMNGAVADVVRPENRAAAFGVLLASLSVGYCVSAFIAPFFSRDHILQIAAVLFVLRVAWAMIILPETLPFQARMKKTRWVMENPISVMSILFRNKLFLRLTCLIVLTSFATSGMSQIQLFYLNTIVGFDVKDFGNLMLLWVVLALLVQGLLLKPLITCFKEKGVIIIATIASFVKTVGYIGTAFYPQKWVVYALCVPGSLNDLSFPAIAALKSMNVSEKEQGRLQGAIYGARSVFDALGPVIFSSLYAAMTQQSVVSQALPYFVASSIIFVGIGVAMSLPVGRPSFSWNIIAATAPVPSETCGDTPSSSSVYFETDDDEVDEDEEHASDTKNGDDDTYLVEPLLKNSSTTGYAHTERRLE